MAQTTILLTLGRLPKALELARAFHAAGCRVVVAEPFARHVCRPSRAVARSVKVTAPNTDKQRYLDEIAAIAREEDARLIVPVSEEALHVAEVAARLGPQTRLFGSGLDTLTLLHDKVEFPRLCVKLGLPAPVTFDAMEPQARAFAKENDHVVKPRHSCSGIGVELRKTGDPRPFPPGTLVQQMQKGRHVSTFSLASEGRERVSVAYEGTVFSGTVAVAFRRVDDAPGVMDWVRRFIAASRHDGFVSFDFIFGEDGRPLAVECNPRVTSGVHFVEPLDLARAILDPQGVHPVRLRAGTRFQQGYSTLTEAYANFLRPREMWRCLGEMARSRDVVWSARDPLPFALMTPMSWDILRPAMFEGVPMAEAAMRDVAWFGGAEETRPEPERRETGQFNAAASHGT